MDLRTPRDAGGSPLVRSTDVARRALRRARIGLAVLAVAIAVPVGIAAAATQPSSVEAELTGLLAGVGTLLTCWGLLGLGLAGWQTHLDRIDDVRWDSEWARVEPAWSGRPQR